MGQWKGRNETLVGIANLEERRAQISIMRHVVSEALAASGVKDANQAAAVAVYALDCAGYEISKKESAQ